MKIDSLKASLEKEGFKFVGVTFLEDGYETRFRLEAEKFEDEAEFLRYAESCTDKVCNFNAPGFVVSEVIFEDKMYMITLVPKSMDEMTDFIWKYVEKYGRREERLADILGDAFCALEKAIANIPNNYEEKAEAQSNFERFSGMVF